MMNAAAVSKRTTLRSCHMSSRAVDSRVGVYPTGDSAASRWSDAISSLLSDAASLDGAETTSSRGNAGGGATSRSTSAFRDS